MICRSISTVAFHTGLIIKVIHYHSTLYIVHDKRNGTVFTKTILICSVSKILKQYFIHNSKTYANDRNISVCIQ